MNITFILVVLLFVWFGIRGYRRGMTKEISNLVAWAVTLFVISIIIMLFSSVLSNSGRNIAYSIIILIIVGLVYGIVRIVFKSVRMISKLPVFHLLDKILGIVVGLCEVVLIMWLLYVLNVVGLLGSFGEILSQDTMNSRLLYMLYEHNYLARLIAGF